MGQIRQRKAEARLAARQPFLFQPRDIRGGKGHRRGAGDKKQTLALRRREGRREERIPFFDEADGGGLEDRLRSDTFRRLAALRAVGRRSV